MTNERANSLQTANIFRDIPEELPEELFTVIASSPSLRIERIVSNGQHTPEGEWCDQDENEWVLLLKGRARLAFHQAQYELDMAPGDHVLIPARCRHRVLSTADDEVTVWLAVHFGAADKG